MKKGKGLPKLSVAERHRVRIHAKRMRYGSEFFSATFPGKRQAKRCRKSLAALELLQDSLGTLNDIANRQTIFNIGGAGHESGTMPMPKVDPGEEKALMKTAKHAYARFATSNPFGRPRRITPQAERRRRGRPGDSSHHRASGAHDLRAGVLLR